MSTSGSKQPDGWVAVRNCGRKQVVFATQIPAKSVTLRMLNNWRKLVDATNYEGKVQQLDIVHKNGTMTICAAVEVTRHTTHDYVRDLLRQFIGFVRRVGIIQKPMLCRLLPTH